MGGGGTPASWGDHIPKQGDLPCGVDTQGSWNLTSLPYLKKVKQRGNVMKKGPVPGVYLVFLKWGRKVKKDKGKLS